MVQLFSAAATGRDTASVLDEIDAGMLEDAIPARFVCASYGCEHDAGRILDRLRDRYPYASIIGGTSGFDASLPDPSAGAATIGLVAICDADGDYGVGAAAWDGDPVAAAQRALDAALEDAGFPLTAPSLVWVFRAPGHEDAVAGALRDILGTACPIIDSNAAAEGPADSWRQIGPEGVMTDGLVIGVLCPFAGALTVAGSSQGVPSIRLDTSSDPRQGAPLRRRTGMS